MVFFYLAAVYFLFVWGVLRLIVPHLGFTKSALPNELPSVLREKIAEYDRLARDDFDFLRLCYDYVTTTYTGSRIRTITQFWKAFENPLAAGPGFLPCISQNYVLRTMLVSSGRFKDTDIAVGIVPLNFFVHQYLQISLGDMIIAADPWSHFLGVPLGKKSAFFG